MFDLTLETSADASEGSSTSSPFTLLGRALLRCLGPMKCTAQGQRYYLPPSHSPPSSGAREAMVRRNGPRISDGKRGSSSDGFWWPNQARCLVSSSLTT